MLKDPVIVKLSEKVKEGEVPTASKVTPPTEETE